MSPLLVISPSNDLTDPTDWLTQHPVVTASLGAFCLWVSFCFILHLWLVQRRDAFAKKLVWTFFLMVPALGWMFYAAFFHPPSYNDVICHVSPMGDG